LRCFYHVWRGQALSLISRREAWLITRNQSRLVANMTVQTRSLMTRPRGGRGKDQRRVLTLPCRFVPVVSQFPFDARYQYFEKAARTILCDDTKRFGQALHRHLV